MIWFTALSGLISKRINQRFGTVNSTEQVEELQKLQEEQRRQEEERRQRNTIIAISITAVVLVGAVLAFMAYQKRNELRTVKQ